MTAPTTSVGGGEPLGGAHFVLPAPAASIDHLGTALDNLALAAADDTTVLQQLTSATLALTTSIATLTAANKKLSEALAKVLTTTPRTPGTPWPPNKGKLFLGITVRLMAIVSASFTRVQHAAMASNKMGGSEVDKGWNTHRT